jgi:hypothetical protein
LKSIPIGLKRLKNLQEVDLRNNPFDKDCVIPITLPVRTVAFKDREWIRVLQAYLGNPNKVPSKYHERNFKEFSSPLTSSDLQL